MKKDTTNIIIFSIQESFITLFPYFVMRAAVTLLQLINDYYSLIDPNGLNYAAAIFYHLFPMLLVISLSIQLSKNFHINSSNYTISSVLVFGLLSGYFSITDSVLVVDSTKSIFIGILIPILGIILILLTKMVLSKTSYNMETKEKESFLSSWSYVYFNIPAILLALSPLSYYSDIFMNYIFSIFTKFSIDIQALIHLLLSHILWIFGIHGTTLYHYLFDMEFYTEQIYTNFTHEALFSTLVNFGGAGSTLSLIIAILIASKSKYYKFVAKNSIPFSIFNINEPLIYGLPIILNRRFILPFILTPLVHFYLSICALELNILTIVNPKIPWSTPALISGYMLTDSMVGLLWQLFLIILGVFIYMPFVKDGHSKYNIIEQLKDKLSFDNQLNKDIRNYSYHKKQMYLKTEENKISLDLQSITEGELILYYQPQINTNDNSIYGYEALLRLKKKNKILPPLFLDAIEKSGLEEVIDLWTIDSVAKDSKYWFNTKKIHPKISINIYPKTLLNQKNIDYIIHILSGQNIQIELLEKGFKENISIIKNAIEQLQNAGFNIAIDDYGSKESNLTLLGSISSDIIKLDITLIKTISNTNGKMLFLENCKTLKLLNVTLIAEGVETQEEIDFLNISEIDVIQGWYYSRALPLKDAMNYNPLDGSKKDTELIYPTPLYSQVK